MLFRTVAVTLAAVAWTAVSQSVTLSLFAGSECAGNPEVRGNFECDGGLVPLATVERSTQ